MLLGHLVWPLLVCIKVQQSSAAYPVAHRILRWQISMVCCGASSSFSFPPFFVAKAHSCPIVLDRRASEPMKRPTWFPHAVFLRTKAEETLSAFPLFHTMGAELMCVE
ncbi:hypothetical protein J3F84DRAFT_341869 [Trichoderma pleuroticola]